MPAIQEGKGRSIHYQYCHWCTWKISRDSS